jgi:hypothetical protein
MLKKVSNNFEPKLKVSKRKMVNNYLEIQNNLYKVSEYIGKINTREEWNKIIKTLLKSLRDSFIHPQMGIQGNKTGTVSIKSTSFGSIKYKEDNFKQENGYLYYETQENKNGEDWDKNVYNKTFIYSKNEKKSFLVFQGKNDSLKLLGLGQIEEIFIATSKKTAIIKIKI